jgi:hypothetical protein
MLSDDILPNDTTLSYQVTIFLVLADSNMLTADINVLYYDKNTFCKITFLYQSGRDCGFGIFYLLSS